MDRRERYDDALEAVRTAQDANQASVWTALPGIVQSFNAAALTVTVQPAVQGKITDQMGKASNVNLPLLVDVPVVFPHGGGYSLTFPVLAGDECLVVFTSRCMDGWWQDGGVQPALDRRMHDLSDGMAILGPWSQKRKLANVSTGATQLRSDDGATLIGLWSGKVTVQAASVILDSPEVHCTGKLSAAGDVTAGTVSVMTHVHTGVQTGSGISGPPKP